MMLAVVFMFAVLLVLMLVWLVLMICYCITVVVTVVDVGVGMSGVIIASCRVCVVDHCVAVIYGVIVCYTVSVVLTIIGISVGVDIGIGVVDVDICYVACVVVRSDHFVGACGCGFGSGCVGVGVICVVVCTTVYGDGISVGGAVGFTNYGVDVDDVVGVVSVAVECRSILVVDDWC